MILELSKMLKQVSVLAVFCQNRYLFWKLKQGKQEH
jgi:hypothetical protein